MLARYTTMASHDDIVVPNVDWSQLDGESLRDTDRRNTLLNDLQARLPEARILLLHLDRSWEPDQISATSDTHPDESAGPGGGTADSEPNIRELPVDLARSISARAPSGMFHIVSQISPNAAGNLEDLTLLDRSDPRQWLLLIITSDDEGNYNIYRRLIRNNDA